MLTHFATSTHQAVQTIYSCIHPKFTNSRIHENIYLSIRITLAQINNHPAYPIKFHRPTCVRTRLAGSSAHSSIQASVKSSLGSGGRKRASLLLDFISLTCTILMVLTVIGFDSSTFSLSSKLPEITLKTSKYIVASPWL